MSLTRGPYFLTAVPFWYSDDAFCTREDFFFNCPSLQHVLKALIHVIPHCHQRFSQGLIERVEVVVVQLYNEQIAHAHRISLGFCKSRRTRRSDTQCCLTLVLFFQEIDIFLKSARIIFMILLAIFESRISDSMWCLLTTNPE